MRPQGKRVAHPSRTIRHRISFTKNVTDMNPLKASNIILNRRNQAKAGMIRRNFMNNKINSSDGVTLKPNTRITSQKRHVSNIDP
ncbi:polyprotein [Sesbania bispinosa]|nr:polyprotein [Sesbania bispinosa]